MRTETTLSPCNLTDGEMGQRAYQTDNRIAIALAERLDAVTAEMDTVSEAYIDGDSEALYEALEGLDPNREDDRYLPYTVVVRGVTNPRETHVIQTMAENAEEAAAEAVEEADGGNPRYKPIYVAVGHQENLI